ncbi:MAG: CdaR family transcriptional regulator [Sarcina sp.]
MLNKVLAQDIVDRMMDIIHHNVNIMDKDAIIIASGENKRIGTTHEGAKQALLNKETVELDCKKSKVQIEGIKCGVNIPIRFNNRIIGVIGVTGNPDKVRDFANLVKVTAELLITQEYSIQKFIIKNKIKEEYLLEWLYKRDKYDDDFIERGADVGIDVSGRYSIYLVEYKNIRETILVNNIKSFLGEDEYFIYIGENRIVIMLSFEKRKDLTFLLKGKYRTDINRTITSEFKENLAYEFYIMKNALANAEKIGFSDAFINERKDIRFLSSIGEYLEKSNSHEIIKKIKEEGKEIFETFLTFSNLNFEKAKTAKNLHIHRNTLSYRIDKIQNITGLSYDNLIGRFRLEGAYLYYMIISQNNKK